MGLRAMLKSCQIDVDKIVDVAMNGQEAVDCIETGLKLGLEYKLVLTDFSMPVMDGLEATRKIKKLYIGKKNQIRIVGITGHTDETFKKKAFA